MSEKPVRVQLKRTKGWRMPENTVKVDRTTKWGNPFVVDEPDALSKFLGSKWYVTHGGMKFNDIVDLYARTESEEPYVMFGWDRHSAASIAVARFREVVARFLPLEEIRGKNLACWCKLGDPCHADVLLELANSNPKPTGNTPQPQDSIEDAGGVGEP